MSHSDGVLPMKVAVVTLLLLVPSVHAQAPSLVVGQKVVTKRQTPLMNEGKAVDQDAAFRIYEVERVERDRVYISWRGRKGWVPAEALIPSSQATDYFTREIARDPKAWWAFDEDRVFRVYTVRSVEGQRVLIEADSVDRPVPFR